MGKRSGEGFIAHKATLIDSLQRAVAERVTIADVTIGRKGFESYLKALGGSNIVKVVPSSSNGSAGDSQTATPNKKSLKVICGNSQS